MITIQSLSSDDYNVEFSSSDNYITEASLPAKVHTKNLYKILYKKFVQNFVQKICTKLCTKNLCKAQYN